MANFKVLRKMLQEIDMGAKDKTRTASDITDPDIKNIVIKASGLSIRSGITASLMGGATAVASTTASMTLLGAGIGSFVPVIGPIVGISAGFLAGTITSMANKKKYDKEFEILMQEFRKKQNTVIRDLQKEVDELVAENKALADQNERYRYLIGILKANEDLKRAFA